MKKVLSFEDVKKINEVVVRFEGTKIEFWKEVGKMYLTRDALNIRMADYIDKALEEMDGGIDGAGYMFGGNCDYCGVDCTEIIKWATSTALIIIGEIPELASLDNIAYILTRQLIFHVLNGTLREYIAKFTN